jgi:hypothetical protein
MLKRFALLLVFASFSIGTARAQTFIDLATAQPTDVFEHVGGVYGDYGTWMFYPSDAPFDLVSLNLSCVGYETVRCWITSSAGGMIELVSGGFETADQTFNLTTDPDFQGIRWLTWYVTASVENPVDLPVGFSYISDLQTVPDAVANPDNVAPEPPSQFLFGTGLLGFAAFFWHRRRLTQKQRM